MRWLPLVAALCGMAASTLQQTLFASAAPTIVLEFHASWMYPWIAGCYLMASALTLPWAGAVTDRLGPRPMYVAGSVTFITGTLATSLPAGPALFLAARAVQGIGAGLLVPAALVIVSSLQSNRDRGRAYGLVGLVQMAANVAGPPLGGWLADGIGWRWGLAVSAPIASAGLLLAGRTMTSRAISPQWWKVSPEQLVDIHASTTVRRLLITTLFIGGLTVSVTTYLPWALIFRHGLTATSSGWVLVPTLLSSALGSIVGGTVARHPLALRTATGSLLLALPLALIDTTPMLAAAGAVIGLGCGAALPIILTLVQESSTKDKVALNTSWIQLSRHAGAATVVPAIGLWTTSNSVAHAAAGILACLTAVACCATTVAFHVPPPPHPPSAPTSSPYAPSERTREMSNNDLNSPQTATTVPATSDGIWPDGADRWTVTGFAEAREVLASRHFSVTPPDARTQPTPPGVFHLMDDPEHTRLRGLVAAEFSARSMQRLRPFVTKRAQELLDRVSHTGSFDFVKEVAQPYPLMVMSDFLGIDHDDRKRLLGTAREALTTTHQDDQRAAALTHVGEYLRPLLTQSIHQNSVVGRLARKEGASEDEKAGILAQVLIAGYIVPTNFLAHGLVTLLRENALSGYATPTGADATTQELLRFLAFESRPRMRYATAAQNVNTTGIQNGQQVAVILEAANRDPRRWTQPEAFDPLREHQANMAFGHGPHQCLGQGLARLEINAVFTELFRKFPHIELDTTSPLDADNSTVTKALRSLWVVTNA